MMEEEVKLLRERVLVIDSEICEQHLGVPWERPPMGLVELSGPPQPQKPLLGSQRRTDLSVGPGPEVHTDGTDVGVDKGAGAVPQSESGAEVEEGKLSMETMKKVKELLCAEAVRNKFPLHLCSWESPRSRCLSRGGQEVDTSSFFNHKYNNMCLCAYNKSK